MSALSLTLTEVAKERIAELSARAFDDLVLLPTQSSEEEVVRDGYMLKLTVWHDLLASGEHRIVVQVGKPGMLASWRLHADGFVIKNRNERRKLTEEELSTFC